MNVTSIGQGGGSVVTLPRPQADAQVQPQSQRTGPQPTAADVPRYDAPGAAAESFARIAWFDVNGDGRIDGRSALDGGDGTLLIPAHTASAPRYSRTAHAVHEEAADAHGAAQPTHDAQPAQSVQTRQAIDSYQRYGQSTDNAPTDQAVA